MTLIQYRGKRKTNTLKPFNSIIAMIMEEKRFNCKYGAPYFGALFKLYVHLMNAYDRNVK